MAQAKPKAETPEMPEFLVLTNENAEKFQAMLNEAYSGGYKLIASFAKETLFVAVMQLK